MILQISVFLENTQGRLKDALEVINENSIDLRALTVAETADYGILRLIPDNPQKTLEKLKENNFIAKETEVLAVEIDDKKGSMFEVVRILSDENINIEYSYSCVSAKLNKAIIIFKVDDIDNVKEKLSKYNDFKLLQSGDLI